MPRIPRAVLPSAAATLLAAALLLHAGPALAASITYELQHGVESGFGFSALHDADGGAHLGDLYGTLTFDWNEGSDTYLFAGSTVWLDSKAYTFEIVGGVVDGSGAGFLSFMMEGSGPYAQEGEIVYAAGSVCCGSGGPNTVAPSQLRLWGAVDIGPGDGVDGAPGRFGMQLGANAVPEPSAAIVFALGALVLGRRAGRTG